MNKNKICGKSGIVDAEFILNRLYTEQDPLRHRQDYFQDQQKIGMILTE
jgi:hypothetical protein